MKKDETAPAALEPVRLFVNTVNLEQPSTTDELGSAERASAWLRANGISQEPVSASETVRLRDLREAIRGALLAHTGGDTDVAEREVAALLSGSSVQWSCHGPRLTLEPAGDTNIERIRSTFAIAIYDAMANGTWRRLKACRKDTCWYAFFDHSKNGSGAWCDMSTCGNRVKAAKRRAASRDRSS